MFNLLPEKTKKEIKSEYKIRRFNVLLTSLLVVQIIALATLFPSYIFSYINSVEISRELESLKIAELPEETEEINRKISDVNRKVLKLTPSEDQVFVNDLVSLILDEVRDGVEVQGISYSKEPEGRFAVNFSGLAGTREDMVSFVSRIEDKEDFSEVNLPVSDLAKSRDINFSLKIIGQYLQ